MLLVQLDIIITHISYAWVIIVYTGCIIMYVYVNSYCAKTTDIFTFTKYAVWEDLSPDIKTWQARAGQSWGKQFFITSDKKHKSVSIIYKLARPD